MATKEGLYKAKVDIGDADLITVGDINISARGTADVEVQVNAETYGAATVAIGESLIDFHPINDVTVRNGATIRADGDVNISTGTSSDFVRDEYHLDSRMDTFAGSAIPIDDIDAKAFVLQENIITVESTALLESSGNIRLHAERLGLADASAQAKAVNWASAATDAVNSAFGGTETFEGTAQSESHGIVQVDGTVRTGTKRNKELVLDQFNLTAGTVGNSQPSEITYTVSQEVVKSSLGKSLDDAEANLAQYRDSGNQDLIDFYEDEIARLQAEMIELGLYDEQLYLAEGIFLPVEEQYAITVTVDPVFAEAGIIDIRGDQLQGAGSFDAPSDASITITNDTPAFLVIGGMEIPESNGGLFLNGEEVSAIDADPTLAEINAAIEEENRDNRDDDNDQNLGSRDNGDQVAGDANFTSITPTGTTSPPTILVENTYNILDTGLSDLPPWPDLTIDGDVYAPRATATFTTYTSGKGDIVLNGNITVFELIQSAGGSLFINQPEGTSFSAAGEPASKWLDSTGGNALTGRDGILQAEVPGSNSSAVTNFLNELPTEISIQATRISITAEYININGIVQSGRPNYELTLGNAVADEITTRLGRGETGLFSLDELSGEEFLVRFDATNRAIQIEELFVEGGFIDLEGNISNTRNGELRVLSGYADIDITNDTDYDLIIKRIDASRRGTGKLIIKDKFKTDSANDFDTNPYTTIYEMGDDLNVLKEETGRSDVTLSTVDPAADILRSDTYRPGWVYDSNGVLQQLGLRYGWAVGQETAEREITTYATSKWLNIDAFAADPDDVVDRETENLGEPTLIPDSAYFFVDPNKLGVRYDYDYERVVEDENTYEDQWTTETWYGKKTYWTEQTVEEFGTDIHSHDIKADRDIKISFMGYEEGNVTITSTGGGRVLLDGAITNSGVTSIDSNTTIETTGETGSVGGRRVELSADDGIGSVTSPVLTEVSDVDQASLSATTIAGPIHLSQLPGKSIRIDQVAAGAGENVSITASESILVGQAGAEAADNATVSEGDDYAGLIAGGSITLTAEGGSVGERVDSSTLRLIQIDSGTQKKDKVNVSASSEGIFLREIDDLDPATLDNLRVESIVSSGGEVWIEVENGSLLDGNRVETVDDRTLDQLRNGVWGDLALTEETGASDKIQGTLDSYASSRERDYRAYWDFRLTQPDPSVYDPDHVVSLTAEELDFYTAFYNGDQGQIDAVVVNRSLQYHTLHIDYGSYGDQLLDLQAQARYDDLAITLELPTGGSIATDDVWTLRLAGTEFSVTAAANDWTLVDVANGLATDINTDLDLSASVNPDGTISVTGDPAAPFTAASDDDKVTFTGTLVPLTVDFADSGSADTITRTDGGSWLEDGFEAGMAVRIRSGDLDHPTENATEEGEQYRIVDVTDTVITLSDDVELMTETGRQIEAEQRFAYTLTSDEEDTLTSSIRVWTESDLVNLIGSGLLKAVSDTQANEEDPNIAGANITLVVLNGNIGQTEGQSLIDLTADPFVLSEDDKVLLGSAERDDLVYLAGLPVDATVNFDAAAGTITRTGGDWNQSGETVFETGMIIQVEGNTANATEEGPFYTIASVTDNVIYVDLSQTDSVPLQLDETNVDVAVSPIVLDPNGVESTADVTFDGSTGTLTRTDGEDWYVPDQREFAVGMIVQIRGDTFNTTPDGVFLEITNINGSVMTLDVGDVIFESPVSSLATVDFDSTTSTITRASGDWNDFAVGQYIRIEGNTSNETENGEFYEITDINGLTMTLDLDGASFVDESSRSVSIGLGLNAFIDETADVIVDEVVLGVVALQINQREDVDIEASGDVVIQGNDTDIDSEIYLGSEGNLDIITVDTLGKVRIKTGAAIFTAMPGDVNITSGNLLLEAGQGGIGGVDAPFLTDLQPAATITARAKNDIFLTETSGDMNVETMFSQTGGVYLVADGSILDALNFTFTNIQANDIVLYSLTGEIGDATERGELGIDVASTSGTITATAEGSIWLVETALDMNVRNIFSKTGDVNLTATNGSILDAVDLIDPLDPFLWSDPNAATPWLGANSGQDPATEGNDTTLGKADVIGNNITLEASALQTIGEPGNELDIDSDYDGSGNHTLTSKSGGNTYLIEIPASAALDVATYGVLYLNTVETDDTAFITAYSIQNGNPSGANVLGGKTYLVASYAIGVDGNPVTTATGNFEALTTGADDGHGNLIGGDIWIQNLGSMTVGGVVEQASGFGVSAYGDLHVIASSPITITESETAGGYIEKISADDANDSDCLCVNGLVGTPNTPDNRDDDLDILVVKSGVTLTAGTYVRLFAGDDLIIESGATVEAQGGDIELRVDYQESGADPDTSGGLLFIPGTLIVPMGNQVIIEGNADNDFIAIDHVDTGVPILIRTKEGDDEVYVGSTASAVREDDGSVTRSSDDGTVNTIRDTLTIDTGTAGNDYVEIDETGEASTTSSVVELTNTTITGLGMETDEATPQPVSIHYSAVESLVINLGEGDDEVNVLSTQDGTTATVNTGANSATHTVNVGSNAPTLNGDLNAVDGRLIINADGANDTMNVDDSADTADNGPGR